MWEQNLKRVYQSLTADWKLEWQHAGILLLAAEAGSSWYEMRMHESRCGWQRLFFNDMEAAAPNLVFQIQFMKVSSLFTSNEAALRLLHKHYWNNFKSRWDFQWRYSPTQNRQGFSHIMNFIWSLSRSRGSLLAQHAECSWFSFI